ncbi:TniB family NTP-binding protein [Advenella sp. FME57]|uniref:TniB family NTP-binding protein n=1 Tax=Advenella sp. FME57 TaxID=2742604 RepID=UPI0018694649|nr:TniB family NTP-binding protein [Advenella sp. FME57]
MMDRKQFFNALQAFDTEYVNFAAFGHIIKEMETALDLYRQTGLVRNLLITGESGCGKTSLARSFQMSYPREHLLEQTITPVLLVEVPSLGTIGALARAILSALGDPYPEKGRVVDQTARIVVLLRSCKTQMIILDEAQHVYDRGQRKTQYATADWLKTLINAIEIPVVLLGIPRLENLLQVNVQLRRRFAAPIELSLGSPDSLGFLDANFDVINALIPVLPLPLSLRATSAEDLTRRVYYATDGRVGYLKRLLAAALEVAWENGESEIGVGALADAFTRIWRGGVSKLNPFSQEFVYRRLDRSGEPFAGDRQA